MLPIIAQLSREGMLRGVQDAALLHQGRNGTRVYRVRTGQEEFILKQGGTSRHEDLREYRFYQLAQALALPYTPRLLGAQRHPEFGLLLLLSAYRPLARSQHGQALHYQLAEVCARLHFADGPKLIKALGLRHKPPGGAQSLRGGFESWCRLAGRHPALSLTRLTQVYQRLPFLLEPLRQAPFQYMHGDLHPENILLNQEGQVVLCDWQSYRAGKGAGDLAFYVQRAQADGLAVDRHTLFDCYAKWARHHGRIRLPESRLRAEWFASMLYATFVLWPESLQDAPGDQVGRVYSMLMEAFEAVG